MCLDDFDVVVFFNENKEVALNRIFRELDTFKSMQTPQITPKLEADAHEIRWICTTGCPKETYGNFVLNRKNLELRSATEKFNCKVVPIYIDRDNGIKFKLKIFEPIKFSNEDSLEKITENLNLWLEKRIIENPSKWIWTHNRWK